MLGGRHVRWCFRGEEFRPLTCRLSRNCRRMTVIRSSAFEPPNGDDYSARRPSQTVLGSLVVRATVNIRALYGISVSASASESNTTSVDLKRLDTFSTSAGLVERDRNFDCDENGALVLPSDLSIVPPLLDRFRLCARIGEGSFSQTILAEDTLYGDRREVAVKIVHQQFNVIGHEVCHYLHVLGSLDFTLSLETCKLLMLTVCRRQNGFVG
jgi:hypothetical protein